MFTKFIAIVASKYDVGIIKFTSLLQCAYETAYSIINRHERLQAIAVASCDSGNSTIIEFRQIFDDFRFITHVLFIKRRGVRGIVVVEQAAVSRRGNWTLGIARPGNSSPMG